MSNEYFGPMLYSMLRTRVKSDARSHVHEVIDALSELAAETIDAGGVIEIPGLGLVGNPERIAELRDADAKAAAVKRAAKREATNAKNSRKKTARGKTKVASRETGKGRAKARSTATKRSERPRAKVRIKS